MSLRARLAIITVVAVALALVIANIAIGRYVDDFLTDKRDEQLNGLIIPSAESLSRAEVPRPSRAGDELGPRFGGDSDASLDLGDVYSELRDADGNIVAARFVFGTDQPVPDLPEHVELRPGQREYFDVGAPGGTPYRVVAEHLPDSEFTVLAALPVNDIEDTLQQLLLIQVGASAAVLLGVLGLAWWLTGLGLRPLRRMEGTAASIAAGDLSQRVEPSGDRTEIARLGKSLNGMLAEIEGAFAVQAASEQRLRQFVADASHELRTPLTAVRGYAELFRRGAADDPEELPKAMRRIEEEAARMGGLVDDMLTLARLDEHRPLDAEPVDLVDLAAGAVSDLRTLDPDRPVELDAPDALVVVGRPRPAHAGGREPPGERAGAHAGRHRGRGGAAVGRRRRGDGGGRPRAGHRSRAGGVDLRSSRSHRLVAHPSGRGRCRPRPGDRRGDRRGARRHLRGAGDAPRSGWRRRIDLLGAAAPRAGGARLGPRRSERDVGRQGDESRV